MATLANINFGAALQTLGQKLEMQSVIPGTILLNTIVHTYYDMSGFDSTGGTRVYWTSIDAPDLSPVTTSPALVGSLQYPHVVGKYSV
ncbi:hypothetical protein [Methylovulum sp.]|uniref:hypothetical protein n=1 Tax=Methylovulum sp. TaxID=1916980 RepID=UPI002616E651|nr:hypothetical protein [Methylovulum sp.]MDD5125800.1 hypothetical protein [Methylovulum sp.]